MKKIISYMAVCAILLGMLAACAPAATPTAVQTIKLKIAVANYISNAPLFIARDEGFFSEQGLEVELIDFGSTSNDILPALAARKLDMGNLPLSVGIFNAISAGNNVKYVADKGFFNPDNCVTDAFVASTAVLASGDLNSADGIKGKKFVFPTGDTYEYMADTLLGKYGLTQSDVQVTSVTDSAARIEGLKNGSIDVSMLSEPWISRAKSEGAGEAWMSLAKIIPGMSGSMIAFGPSILEDNPEAGRRFMVAYLKAIAQFNQGKTDRNVEIIAGYTKLDPAAIKASCWTSFRTDGKIDTAALMAFQDWGLGKGYINSKIQLDQIWTSEFVDQALKELNK
jgi:NitT/TauT family transport system substrate-binding protein